MLSNHKHGWCRFSIGDFRRNASYLTDAPVDALSAFIDYFQKGNGVAVFDEEGAEFTLILTQYNNNIYIIEERETAVLYDFSDLDIMELAKELFVDIETDTNGWAEFTTNESDSDKVRHHRMVIQQCIRELKTFLN